MLLFFTIIMIEILSGAEMDLFIPSFPELQATFHLSPFMVQFMLSANMAAFCICSLFSGVLGDRYNRRKVMLISLGILLLGSVLCVSATNYPVLLIGRILQGIGMAGPAVLAYPIISDNYPIGKQAGMLGILNGASTLAMAFAPVIGSYVNLYFNWRGNFTILLAFSLFCLVLSYFVIPNRAGSSTVSVSPKTYWVLLRSPQLLTFTLFFCFLVTPYWIFVGISPILYMQDFGVTLKEFGYYQGAITFFFAITCFASAPILSKFGHKKFLYVGILTCILSALLMIILMVSHNHNPLILTIVVVVMAAGAVFPINILFPQSLTVIENSKGRTAALMLAARLILTAVTLVIVGYFYTGDFLALGLAMVILLILSVFCIVILISKRWVVLK